MSYDVRGERLAAVADQMDALLDYANATTGAGDTRIGDAMKTLADGYGQGGGGGNVQKTEIGTITLTGNAETIELPKTINIDNLSQIDFVIRFPTQLSANVGVFCGFSANSTPITEEKKQFQIGGRSGNNIGLVNYFASQGLSTVGYCVITAPNAYSFQNSPGYSRKIPRGAKYFNVSEAKEALAGATVTIYTYNMI